MIGIKEINLGSKIAKKHKNAFSNFMDHNFYVRIFLVDEKTGLDIRVQEYVVNKDNWMDYVKNADFKGYKVDKIEFSASGR